MTPIDYVVVNLPVMGVVLVVGVIASGILLIARGQNKDEAMKGFSQKIDDWNIFEGHVYSVGKEIPPEVPEETDTVHIGRWD